MEEKQVLKCEKTYLEKGWLGKESQNEGVRSGSLDTFRHKNQLLALDEMSKKNDEGID